MSSAEAVPDRAKEMEVDEAVPSGGEEEGLGVSFKPVTPEHSEAHEVGSVEASGAGSSSNIHGSGRGSAPVGQPTPQPARRGRPPKGSSPKRKMADRGDEDEGAAEAAEAEDAVGEEEQEGEGEGEDDNEWNGQMSGEMNRWYPCWEGHPILDLPRDSSQQHIDLLQKITVIPAAEISPPQEAPGGGAASAPSLATILEDAAAAANTPKKRGRKKKRYNLPHLRGDDGPSPAHAGRPPAAAATAASTHEPPPSPPPSPKVRKAVGAIARKFPEPEGNYIKFVEPSLAQLDTHIEYDMDEEDGAWLEAINKERAEQRQPEITQAVFETIMDRLEKESYFKSSVEGEGGSGQAVEAQCHFDEDAVCCICLSGECENANAILFCDSCNIPVHQECYGVPYIPEGQWLCRKCLQAPSEVVKCCLCPNTGGAMKQTEDGRWAHVACAAWIPETHFGNEVFLEPVMDVDKVPAARHKMTCYLCKKKNAGACIQCYRQNCFASFHVSCGKAAQLCMEWRPKSQSRASYASTAQGRRAAGQDTGNSLEMRKSGRADNGEGEEEEMIQEAFCDLHTPDDAKLEPLVIRRSRPGLPDSIVIKESEKKEVVPTVSVPFISEERLGAIVTHIHGLEDTSSTASSTSSPGKSTSRRSLAGVAGASSTTAGSSSSILTPRQVFLRHIRAYWYLKRKSRHGVPLLRRLQAVHVVDKGEVDRLQRSKFYHLRQELEKARMLAGQVLRREKKKKDIIDVNEALFFTRAFPLESILSCALDSLEKRDRDEVFLNPVDTTTLPDYHTIIATPMDFSTMRRKLEDHEYIKFEEFVDDFHTICYNCVVFNANPESWWYQYALKILDAGNAILEHIAQRVASVGVDPSTGALLTDVPPSSEIPPHYGLDIVYGFTGEMTPEEEELRQRMIATRKQEHPGLRTSAMQRLGAEVRALRQKLGKDPIPLPPSVLAATAAAAKKKALQKKVYVDAPQPEEFHPWDMVWAKDKGWPWFPSEVIDPNVSKEDVPDLFHLPSDAVLSARPDTTEQRYLVMFFDKNRSWAWVPPSSLRLMFADEEADKCKLAEPTKSHMKKQVKDAYASAQEYLKASRSFRSAKFRP